MREKLIELLKQTPIAKINGHIAEAEVCFVSHVFESFADHLIANGVTVQQWIPVSERLPEEEDADEHDCVLVHTSNRDNLIVAREAVWKCTEFVTHWQPLHEPPKGE